MKKRFISQLLSLFGLLWASGVLAQAHPGKRSIDDLLLDWRNSCVLGRELTKWQDVPGGKLGSDDAKEKLHGLVDSMSRVSKGRRAIVEFLIAGASARLGDKNKAREILQRYSSEVIVGPESICWLRQLSDDEAIKARLLRSLVRMIPLSSLGCVLEFEERPSKPNPATPSIPLLTREKMLNVASALRRAGCYDLAWRAYAEFVYCTFSPVHIDASLDGTWLSQEAAEYWIESATCARNAKKEDLAWMFLLKAAIFGSEKTRDVAEKTASQWAEGTQGVELLGEEDVRREALARVIHLYAEMNVHPRALLLLGDYSEALRNSVELRRDIEEQWIAVVRSVLGATTKAILYGVEVHPAGDPLKLKVPWALSEGTMDSVRVGVE